MRQAASTVKKVGLELGGNAPFIVFDDADLDAAVEGAIVSKFRNMGQTCVCANRIYVQEGVYDDFVAKLAKKVDGPEGRQRRRGGVVQGPLITMDAVDKVERHIADAVGQGREGRGRRQAPRARPHLLRADRARRTSRPRCW